MNITEFLEARITEDEREAGSGWERLGENPMGARQLRTEPPNTHRRPSRVRRETGDHC